MLGAAMLRPLTPRLAPLALSLALLGCPSEQGDVASEGKPSDAPAEPQPAPQTPAPRPAYVPPPLLEVPPPTLDSPAIAERGEVVATVQLPGGASLGDLAPMLDGFKPGTAALLRFQLPTILKEATGVDLAGADLSGPIAALVVNPQGRAKPFALLVVVKDLDALREAASAAGQELREREGFALIGPKDVVEVSEAYAFEHLRKQPPHTELVIYPALLVELLAPQMEATFAQLSALGGSSDLSMFESLGKLYVDMLAALGKQSDRIVLSVSVGTTSSDVYLRIYPQPGSTFASFVGAQVPTDHALLAKLPADTGSPFVMSGTLHAGAARDAMIEFGAAAMQAFFPSGFGVEEWTRLVTGMISSFDGTFAAKIDLSMNQPAPGSPPATTPVPSMTMQVLYGSNDAEASRKAWRGMFATMAAPERPPLEVGGMKMLISYQEAALEHEGVVVDGYSTKIDLSTLAPEAQAALAQTNVTSQSMYFAGFDRVIAMASSPEAAAATIDAARGKGQTFVPNEALARALATSRSRGDSFAYYLDFASMLPPNLPEPPPFNAIVMSLGKQGEALSLCMSIQK